MYPALIVVILSVLFGLFRQVRLLFGRQALNPGRLRARLVILVLVGFGLGVATASSSATLLGDAAGLAVGAATAWLALRLTTFERTPGGTWFRPNPWIGVAVALAFLARVAMRIATGMPALSAATAQSGGAGSTASAQLARLGADPLTMAAFFAINGYFIFYVAGLLLRDRRTERTLASVAV